MAADNARFRSIEARRALRAGFVAILPIVVGVVPFGLIYGVTAADAGVSAPLGIGMSSIIFAGAAQLATVQLLDGGAAALVIIATGLVINSRHLMYSASLEPHFRHMSIGRRAFQSYLLTDQAYAVSIAHFSKKDEPRTKTWYFLAAGLTLWVVWHVTTVIGFALGTEVPESWSLDFAIPLVFLALLIPAIEDRFTLAAAASAGLLSVALVDVPLNLGLLVSALAGIVVGFGLERARK